MEDQSYIKLFRSLRDWEWWGDVNVKAAWVTILVMANWKDKKWKGLEIKRGSFFTSLDHLSAEIGISVQQTRTVLKKLKSTGEITTKATNGGTLITVEKWEKYQGLLGTSTSESTSDATDEQQATNKRATNEQQQLKNNKNNKNSKKDIYKGLPDTLIKALKDFEEMRKVIKAPMSDRAKQLLLTELNKLAGDNTDLKVRILEQSISKSWKGVYAIKDGHDIGASHRERIGISADDGRGKGGTSEFQPFVSATGLFGTQNE